MVAGRHAHAKPAESFLGLLDAHGWLEEQFFAHQAALLARDFHEARHRLDVFADGLFRHMADEEVLLLPIYEREPAPAGGSPRLFLAEHRKLLSMLETLRHPLFAIDPEAPDLARWLLDLLDRESRFKNLLKHHDERERNLFYPALDRLATPGERRSKLAMTFRPTVPGRTEDA